MALNSNISWTDHTWNIARGCHKVYDTHPTTKQKVSECEFCYMYRGADGLFAFDAQTVAQTSTKSGGAFKMPLRLPKVQAKIFTSSLTDFWHKDIDSFRLEALAIIMRTPYLTYQILTKRPQNIRKALELAHTQACNLSSNDSGMLNLAYWLGLWLEGKPPVNVWLGTSAGYQHTADKRIPHLLSVPAAKYFVSAEPLLESVSLAPYLPNLDWVIVGGESGNETGFYKYRPCELKWIENLVDECYVADVACWVKQTGTYLAKAIGINDGQDRHGTNPNMWPPTIRFQQFPK
ncbi:DUF5131 family protein [Fibrivirga algicola]|nr:DUF5131 family protein [Fibrivirga algicola]